MTRGIGNDCETLNDMAESGSCGAIIANPAFNPAAP